jgi:hypothetical protein
MVLRPASILGCLPFDPFSVSAHEGFSMGVQVSFGTEDIKQDGIGKQIPGWRNAIR